MQENRNNNKPIDIESFLLVVILFLGLLIGHNSYNNTAPIRHSAISEVSISGNDAIIISSSENNFRIKLFVINDSHFLQSPKAIVRKTENRETQQRLSFIQSEQIKTESSPPVFHHYYMYPSEKDDLPALS